MKKGLLIILSLICVFGLVACTDTGKKSSTSGTTTTSTAKETTTTAAPTTTTTTAAPVVQDPSVFPESGYLAVGIVNAGAKTAKILASNSYIGEITYDGDTAPLPGHIYGYSSKDGKVTLTEVTFINGPINEHDGWGLRLNANPAQIYTNDGTNETLYDFDANTVVFIRYSETEWRLYNGDCVINPEWPCMGYFMPEENPDGGNQLARVVLVGKYDAAKGKFGTVGSVDTFFFDEEGYGWDKGDKIIK